MKNRLVNSSLAKKGVMVIKQKPKEELQKKVALNEGWQFG